jgi:hypothetical protein
VILIATNTQDITSDFVVAELRRRKVAFFRLNFDEFPQGAAGVVAGGSASPWRAEIRWSNRERTLDLNSIGSVLYRRPVSPLPDPSIESPALRRFCVDESYDFLRGLLYSLDARWMSDPGNIRRAEHKVFQIQAAEKVGLCLPRTLVTNEPEEVHSFFEACSGQMVVKCLYKGFVNEPAAPAMIFTSTVTCDDLKDSASIRLCPSIFQERIDKSYDIRVTIVGEKVFAARIDTDTPASIPDWRVSKIEDIRHSLTVLPPTIERSCLDLVRNLGLEFGAIDFVVDKRGNYFFLEINPNGQWAWIETSLGLPISATIVDHLQALDRQ